MGPNYYVTPAPGQSRFSKKTILLGGGLVAAVLIALTLLLSSGGKNISSQLQHLSLRLNALQALLEDRTVSRNIKSAQLSQITTEFQLTLRSNVNQLTPLMVEAGMPEKADSNIAASEADASSAAKLEDAALKSQLDRVYAEMISQKITSLRALTAETYGLTKKAKLRQALSDLDKNLNTTKKRIDGLNL